MRLLFNKDEHGNISVKLVDKDGYTDFSYGEMIKRIYDDKVIEDSDIQGSFTEKERKSINELIDNCRKAVFEEPSEEEQVEIEDLDFM